MARVAVEQILAIAAADANVVLSAEAHGAWAKTGGPHAAAGHAAYFDCAAAVEICEGISAHGSRRVGGNWDCWGA